MCCGGCSTVHRLQATTHSGSRFYESAQAMPTYRSYFDEPINDMYVGFMKRHNDYHVTIPASS